MRRPGFRGELDRELLKLDMRFLLISAVSSVLAILALNGARRAGKNGGYSLAQLTVQKGWM